ncbi:MAG: thioredoxin family protein [Bacteroidota bacterium]|jgi:thiol-disulfide isomerase/thioredoxin|nr:thioredoxin family protein [Bacteroidota bacterium]
MIARIHLILPPFAAVLLLTLTGCGNADDAHGGEAAGTKADSTRIVTLGANNIEEFLAAGGPALIEFGGKRCIPCMEMRDILEDVGATRPDLRIGIVFWEEDPELFEQWKVPLIPAQIVFDGNREVQRHRGTWERDTLLTVLAARFPETHSGD